MGRRIAMGIGGLGLIALGVFSLARGAGVVVLLARGESVDHALSRVCGGLGAGVLISIAGLGLLGESRGGA